MKKKIFITGAEGFIGSHITEKLLTLGYNVTALVLYNFTGDIGNLKYISKNNLKKLNIIFGDISDPETYFKNLKKTNIVINLASLISIPYSYRAPISYFNNNIIGTSNFLAACKNLDLEKFIHFSTSEIYGTPKKIPITETTPLNPQSPYAASKAAIDHVIKSYYYSFDMPVVILRPFNNYGPRQSRRAVIPEIICQILKKNIISLGDINTKRDFLFVEDTANAVLRVIMTNNILGEEFNIGSNKFFKIKDIVNILSKLIQKKIIIKLDKKKIRPLKSEVRHLMCDYSKAKKILKWTPSILKKNFFKNSLLETIRFYEKNYEQLDKIYFND
tara:strand:+ start:952 stop:1944 length:993 start_codon:yes stop_codon:yes gene_type:complete